MKQPLKKLTQKGIDDAVKVAIRENKDLELRDGAGPGLVFRRRVSGHRAWTLRRTISGMDRRLDIGDSWTLDEAREIAWELDRQIRAKNDPWRHQWAQRDWDRFYLAKQAKKNGNPAPVERPPIKVSISWEDGVKMYLDEIALTHKAASVSSKRKELATREFSIFNAYGVSSITSELIATALYKIRDRGAERQCITCYFALKKMFQHLGEGQNRILTGVTKDFHMEIEKPKITRAVNKPVSRQRKKVRVPDGKDVAKIVRYARDPSSPMIERDRLAILLTVYTVQRRMMVANARIEEFSPAHTGGIWTIPPVSRKTATDSEERGVTYGFHVVPLPPSAWKVFLRARELAGDSEYLFPPSPDRTTGLDALHLNESTLTHAIRKASGGTFSPHDVRRAFGTTYAEAAKMDELDGKKILDHSEGKKPSVILKHYRFLDGTDEKWPLISGWCDWVDEHAK
jgi:integrase